MKRKIIFFLVICIMTISAYADRVNRGFIYVPENYATIQAAIEAAEDADVIIVSPGTYMENINFNGKAITVASLFYTTQDTSYITQTVIDGGQLGSVVTFDNGEGANSVLTGFTVTNGYSTSVGGGIFTGNYCSPILNNLKINNNQAEWNGGGFYFGEYCNASLEKLLVENNYSYYGGGGAYSYYCDMIMEDSIIRNNEAENAGGGIFSEETDLHFEDVLIENNISQIGGGMYFNNGNSTLKNVFIYQNQAGTAAGIFAEGLLYLENVTITANVAEESCGGLYCGWNSVTFAEEINKRCSIYQNEAGIPWGIDLYSYYYSLEVYLTAFSVLHPSSYYAAPSNNFTFDIQFGITQQLDADLYISPAGDDENSGLAAESPFRTIEHAFELILASAEIPKTIYLGEGIYSSSSNGESFPLYLPDNIRLCGENRENVIIDAESNNNVISLEHVDNVTVSGLTVTNGNSYYGAGIRCQEASPVLEDLKIINNNANYSGGGIYVGNYSYPIMRNLVIAGNTADYYGGGIYFNDIYANCIIVNVTIANNTAGNQGGGIFTYYSDMTIINSIFWNNIPEQVYNTGYHGYLTLAYADIQGGESGIEGDFNDITWLDGNIEEDPLFADVENGDYRLLEGSPCIDAGTSYLEIADSVLVNMSEDEYWGIAPDMGAYEYFIITDNDEEEIIPGTVSMYNYPNPFNPETTVRYQLVESGKVSIEVYNIKGQKVAVLLDKEQEAGEHDLTWDAAGMNSGIYFISLTSGEYQKTNKVILLK